MSKKRSNQWTFIVYPESAPENWRDIINELHIEWVESPLHDKDLNPDGNIKKAHYHVYVKFASLKSYNQVLEMFQEKIQCTVPLVVHSGRSLVRYFAHLDNPSKFQYDETTIVPHGGADLKDLLTKTFSEESSILSEIENFIIEKKVNDLISLVYYATRYRKDWIDIIRRKNTFYINSIIKSVRHASYIIDYETGEMINLNYREEEKEKTGQEDNQLDNEK